MKKLLLMKTVLLLFALVVGSGSVWATTKITAINNIVDGGRYYIGATTGSTPTDYFLQLPASSGDKGTAVTSSSSATEFIFEAVSGKTNVYKIKIADTSNYLSTLPNSSSPNGKLTFGTTAAEYTASNQGSLIRLSNNSRSIQKNNTGTQFGSYGSTQTDIWLSPVATYTITPAVNDGNMGSATVNGLTITATPNAGYRVKAGTEGYTVTTGTANVTNNGDNTFTVTPSSNCTVQVNFEAIPTHTITCVADPVGAGTFDAVSSLYEGATTDIRAIANSGYKFTGWSISGTGASLSSTSTNPTTLTMGTANATVTATFETVKTYAITYSVNGHETTVNVEENKAVDLSAPASGIPAGYVFRGWVVAANKIDTPTDTDPKANYVTSATSTANITYYAVMAVQTAILPDTYEKLGSNSFDTNATYVIGAKQGGSGDDSETMWYFRSYANTDQNSDWGVMTSDPANYSPITFTLSGTASALVAKDNSGNYLKGVTSKFYMSSTSVTIYLNSDGAIKAASDGYLLRHNYNSGNGGLRWYSGSTGQQAYFYKVVKNGTYANYCTSLPANVSITPAKPYTTLTSKYPLDFTSSDLKAFIATEIADSKVQMTQVNKVPANTGLVLKATSTGSAINVPVLSGAADDVTDNKMAGSAFSTTAIAANAGYILSDGVFQPASAGTLAAGKAYLNIAVGSGARALEMTFDEDVTAINATLNNRGEMTNDSYFNLAGQRVANPTKGLYIVNGKKVIIK